MKKFVITLTSAQLLALNSGALELIPAPGAGKFLNLIYVVAEYIFGTQPYDVNGGNINLQLGPAAPVPQFIVPADMMTRFSSQIEQEVTQENVTPLINMEDLGLYAFATAAFTGGDGSVKLFIFYTEESV